MSSYSIEQVLPHKAPMILLDSLLQYDESSCSCLTKISANSAFYDEQQQGVPTYIGSEYMAQTIAAFAGAHALDNHEDVQIGFLLGSRKYQAYQPFFKLEDQLTITVSELYREDSGLRVFDCQIIDSKNQLLAQANINVFQPDDAEAFIKETS